MSLTLAQQLAQRGHVTKEAADHADGEHRTKAQKEESRRVAWIETKRQQQADADVIAKINVPDDVLIGC